MVDGVAMTPHDVGGEGSENPVLALRELVHELSTLLDGSMRCLRLAQRELDRGPTDADTMRRLETVRGALDRMADLVRLSMSGASGSIGLSGLGSVRPLGLSAAIRHAREVCADRARELGIEIVLRLGTEIEGLSADRLYVVVLNGVRNAIDAIERAGRPGVVIVSAHVLAGELVIEICDDGQGLTVGGAAHGMGVGLGLSRSLVGPMGGTLELSGNADGPGATLRVRVGVPARIADTLACDRLVGR